MNYLKQLLVSKGFAANFDPIEAYENDPDLLRGANHELACSLGLRLSQVPELALYDVLAWAVSWKHGVAQERRARSVLNAFVPDATSPRVTISEAAASCHIATITLEYKTQGEALTRSAKLRERGVACAVDGRCVLVEFSALGLRKEASDTGLTRGQVAPLREHPSLHSSDYGAGYAAFLREDPPPPNPSADWQAGFDASKRHAAAVDGGGESTP